MKKMISMKIREPYKDNRIMSYEELNDFLYQNWNLNIAKVQKHQK